MVHGRRRFVNIPKFIRLIGVYNQNLLVRRFSVGRTYLDRREETDIGGRTYPVLISSTFPTSIENCLCRDGANSCIRLASGFLLARFKIRKREACVSLNIHVPTINITFEYKFHVSLRNYFRDRVCSSSSN